MVELHFMHLFDGIGCSSVKIPGEDMLWILFK